MVVGADGNKTEAVEISQFWAEELKSMPYLTRKCQPVYYPNLFFLLL